MKIRIHKILEGSLVDGPGKRTVLFLQGCPIHCPGCQSQQTWNPEGGQEWEVVALADELTRRGAETGEYTISGGEPFFQPEALLGLLKALRERGANHIIVYTGYELEVLASQNHPARPYLEEILPLVDVLVDGPFRAELDNPFLSYRGSSNQRAIDVPTSMAIGSTVLLEDWGQNPEIVAENGRLVIPIGLYPVFAEVGEGHPTRRCGELMER